MQLRSGMHSSVRFATCSCHPAADASESYAMDSATQKHPDKNEKRERERGRERERERERETEICIYVYRENP